MTVIRATLARVSMVGMCAVPTSLLWLEDFLVAKLAASFPISEFFVQNQSDTTTPSKTGDARPRCAPNGTVLPASLQAHIAMSQLMKKH